MLSIADNGVGFNTTKKRKGIGKKSPDWSFKCNGPGRRYMVVANGSTEVEEIFGGY